MKPLGKKDTLQYDRNNAIMNTLYSTKNTKNQLCRAVSKPGEGDIVTEVSNHGSDFQSENNSWVQLLDQVKKSESMKSKEIMNVLQIIQNLINKPRFDIEWCFTDEDDKKMVKELLHLLQDRIDRIEQKGESDPLRNTFELIAAKVVLT